jgi:hypothetical protein
MHDRSVRRVAHAVYQKSKRNQSIEEGCRPVRGTHNQTWRGLNLAKVRPSGRKDLTIERGWVHAYDFSYGISNLDKVRPDEFCKIT